MADQQVLYLTLLENIASIDPSKHQAEELLRLSKEPVRQDDALAFLVLAEQAAQIGEWQAAAQLFSRMMVGTFSSRYCDADIVSDAERIILLTTGHTTQLRSRTELLLYAHRRLIAALRKDGMQRPYLDEWTVSALSQVLLDSNERRDEMRKAVELFKSRELEVTKGFRREISSTRKLLSCSLRLYEEKNAWIWVSERNRNWHRLLLGLAVALIAILAYRFRHFFPLPLSRGLDDSWFGSLLRTALVAWPFVLVATWVFAFYESQRTHTFHSISPIHLLSRGTVVGKVVPFTQDRFFHIFQFVWIALLMIAWLLFRKYQDLPGWLLSVSNPSAMHPPVWVGYPKAFWNDLLALTAAIIVPAWALRVQRRIQNERHRTSMDFYWWDRRVNPTEWRIRLTMVSVDVFLASFLLAKALTILLATYQLVTTDVLKLSIFSPDGVGGLKDLTDVLMYLSWIVFLSGIFVIASLYLHWGLRAYKRLDLSLFFGYLLLLIVMVMPLLILDSKLWAEKEARLQQLISSSDLSKEPLEEVAKYVQNVNLVNEWRVSAIKVGILGNGILPLGFQFVVILVQVLGRAGKLPKIFRPLWGEKGATAGGHDD